MTPTPRARFLAVVLGLASQAAAATPDPEALAAALAQQQQRLEDLVASLHAAGSPAARSRGLVQLQARLEAQTRALNEVVRRLEEAEAPLPWGGGGATGLGAEGIQVGVDAGRDRWEATREVLAAIGRAYVEQDVSGVMRHLAPGVVPDASIFYNAIQQDYQEETDIQLDMELMSYRMNLEEVCVQLRWNRNAVRKVDGRPRIDQGTSTFCMSRGEELLLARAVGRLPFGLSDPLFQRQAQAGQPNPDPENPSSAPPPEGMRSVVLGLDPSGPNVAFVDIETGLVRRTTAADLEDLPGQAGEDFYVAVDLGVSPPVGICFHRVAQAGVVGCDGGFAQPFSSLRAIDVTRLTDVTDDVFGYHFGVRTNQGNFALVRVADFQQATYLAARDPLVQRTGAVDCP